MSKRILVVEDQLDNRQIIRDMLAPTDYQITEAEDGEQALAAIATSNCQRWTATRRRVKSKATRRCDRSRSSRSLPTRLAGKKRRHEQQDVMIMCPNLLARANCWQGFAISYNSGLVEAAGRHAALAARGPGSSARCTRTAPIAAAKSLSCTMPVVCLPVVIVIGLLTRASRNQPMNVVCGRHRKDARSAPAYV